MQNRHAYFAAVVVALGSMVFGGTSASAYDSYRPVYPNYRAFSPPSMPTWSMERSRSAFDRNLYRYRSTGSTCYDRNGRIVSGRTCMF